MIGMTRIRAERLFFASAMIAIAQLSVIDRNLIPCRHESRHSRSDNTAIGRRASEDLRT